MNKILRLGIFSAATIISVGIVAYVIRFRNNDWANSTTSWAEFSDYLNMFISLASLVLVSILSYIIYIFDLNRNQEELSSKKIRERPILVFQVKRSQNGDKNWFIRNVTENVALNVKVSYSISQNGWQKPVMIYTLGGKEETQLNWFQAALQIRAVYYDIYGNVVTSTIQNDHTEIAPDFNGLELIEEFIRHEEYI